MQKVQNSGVPEGEGLHRRHPATPRQAAAPELGSEARVPMHGLSVCAVYRVRRSSARRFAGAALNHVSSGRGVRCIDCSSPACTREKCTTCPTCRSVGCRKGKHCAGVIHPLPPKQQPKTLADKRSFRCEMCQYPPCQSCGKEMPRGSRQRFTKTGEMNWTCGDCLTVEKSKATLRRNR